MQSLATESYKDNFLGFYKASRVLAWLKPSDLYRGHAPPPRLRKMEICPPPRKNSVPPRDKGGKMTEKRKKRRKTREKEKKGKDLQYFVKSV